MHTYFNEALHTECDDFLRIVKENLLNNDHLIPEHEKTLAGICGEIKERCFGVARNNLKAADYSPLNMELKTSNGRTPMTLGHLQPRMISVDDFGQYDTGYAIKALINSHGYDCVSKRHGPSRRISLTLRHSKWHQRGFTLAHDDATDEIKLVYDPTKVKRSAKDRTGCFKNLGEWADSITDQDVQVAYRLSDVIDMLHNKLNNVAVTKYTRTPDVVRYTQTTVMVGFSKERCREMILSGEVCFEIAASLYKDHGVAMRVPLRKMPALYEHEPYVIVATSSAGHH